MSNIVRCYLKKLFIKDVYIKQTLCLYLYVPNNFLRQCKIPFLFISCDLFYKFDVVRLQG